MQAFQKPVYFQKKSHENRRVLGSDSLWGVW